MSDPNLPEVPSPGAPTEPLITTGWIVTAATALLTLGTAFALPVNNNQQAAILGVVAIVAPLVVAFIGRGKVFAPSTVRALVMRAQARERSNRTGGAPLAG